MYLKRLDGGGFSEWRSMWDREILPYLRSLRPVAGPGVRIDRRPGGTLIRVVPSSATAPAGAKAATYDSYFKLTLSAAENGGHLVTIADGATGGNSVAVVNGYTVYTVPPYTESVSADRLFFLKYTPAVYWNDGSVHTPATLEIGSSGTMILPSGGTDGAFYTQLGRVLWNDGKPRVVQDFSAGVADVRWYAGC